MRKFILRLWFDTGMSELVKERPANPIEYLASYLLRNDPQRAGVPAQQQMTPASQMHR